MAKWATRGHAVSGVVRGEQWGAAGAIGREMGLGAKKTGACGKRYREEPLKKKSFTPKPLTILQEARWLPFTFLTIPFCFLLSDYVPRWPAGRQCSDSQDWGSLRHKSNVKVAPQLATRHKQVCSNCCGVEFDKHLILLSPVFSPCVRYK